MVEVTQFEGGATAAVGLPERLGGGSVAAWGVKTRSGRQYVLKFRAVDQKVILAAQVAHHLGVPTPRVALTESVDACAGLRDQARWLASSESGNDKPMKDVATALEWVLGRPDTRFVMIQDRVTDSSFDNGYGVAYAGQGPGMQMYGSAGAQRDTVVGAIAVLDLLEGKTDLFNDLSSDAFRQTPNGEDEIEINKRNFFINPKSAADIDLGSFDAPNRHHWPQAALVNLRTVGEFLTSGGHAWALSDANYAGAEVTKAWQDDFVNHNVDAIYMGLKAELSLGIRKGEDDSHYWRYMWVRAGMVDAWCVVVAAQPWLRKRFQLLKPDFRANANQLLDKMIQAADGADFARLRGVFEALGTKDQILTDFRLPSWAAERNELLSSRWSTELCELHCSRWRKNSVFALGGPAFLTGHWDEARDCLEFDNRHACSAVEVQVLGATSSRAACSAVEQALRVHRSSVLKRTSFAAASIAKQGHVCEEQCHYVKEQGFDNVVASVTFAGFRGDGRSNMCKATQGLVEVCPKSLMGTWKSASDGGSIVLCTDTGSKLQAFCNAKAHMPSGVVRRVTFSKHQDRADATMVYVSQDDGSRVLHGQLDFGTDAVVFEDGSSWVRDWVTLATETC